MRGYIIMGKETIKENQKETDEKFKQVKAKRKELDENLERMVEKTKRRKKIGG